MLRQSIFLQAGRQFQAFRWYQDYGAAVFQRTVVEDFDCKTGNQAGALRIWGPAAFSCAGATPACCYCNLLRCLWYAQKVYSGAVAGIWNNPIIAPDPTNRYACTFERNAVNAI